MPAPQISTRRPRTAAFSAYSATSRGLRCAEITRISYESARASSSAQAFSMVGRSDSDPMRMPTSGPADSTPGNNCSISAGEGVGLGTSGLGASATGTSGTGTSGLGMADTCFLLCCAHRDVAAHLLAVEFVLERTRHGALPRELQGARRRSHCEHTAAGDHEPAVHE